MLEDCELSFMHSFFFPARARLTASTTPIADNKRATNYSHVVSVDLESFGVYRKPNASSLDRRAKISISELEDDVGSDFQIICEDGRRVFCSRRILEERWPWFAVQTKPYNALATSGNQFLEPSIPPRPSGASQALPRARVRNSQINLQGSSRLPFRTSSFNASSYLSVLSLRRTLPRCSCSDSVLLQPRPRYEGSEHPSGPLGTPRPVLPVPAPAPPPPGSRQDAQGSQRRLGRGDRGGREHLPVRVFVHPGVEDPGERAGGGEKGSVIGGEDDEGGRES